MAAGPSLADAPLARPTLASGDRGLCPSHQTLPLANDHPAPAQVHQHPERDPRTLDRLTSWRQLGAATSIQGPEISHTVLRPLPYVDDGTKAEVTLQRLPRDAELLAFEAGCEEYCEREVEESSDPGCTSILVSGESTRPAASRMMLAGLRAFDCDRMLEAPHPRQARCRQRWMVGNLSGNPGATTRHYGTALDEMGPAPEQP
jgi:hypothetical protein